MITNILEFHQAVTLLRRWITGGNVGAGLLNETTSGLTKFASKKVLSGSVDEKIGQILVEIKNYKDLPTEADEMLKLMMYFETEILHSPDFSSLLISKYNFFYSFYNKLVAHIKENFSSDARLSQYKKMSSAKQIYCFINLTEYFPTLDDLFMQNFGQNADEILKAFPEEEKEPSKMDKAFNKTKEGVSALSNKIGNFFSK